MPNKLPITQFRISVASNSGNTQQNPPSVQSPSQYTASPTSITSSPRLTSLLAKLHQQNSRDTEDQDISPISELSFNLNTPFSDLDSDAQEELIREIMAEDFARPTGYSTPMAAGTADTCYSDLDFNEKLPQLNQGDIDTVFGKSECIDPASPAPDLKEESNITEAQDEKHSSILVNPASIATVKILRLASEKIGTEAGKIERREFEAEHDLSPGSLQNFINADGTLTNLGHRLVHPPPQPKITPEIISQAKFMLKNSNKKIVEIAHGFGFQPSYFYQLLKKSILSPASTKTFSNRPKNKAPQPLTPDLLELATQSIGIGPEKINQVDFCSIHNIPLGLLKRYITVEGNLTSAGRTNLKKNISNASAKQRTVKEAAFRLAKPGQWNFPYADLLFSHSFKIFSQIWNLRFDIQTPEFSHSVGKSYLPSAGTLILKNDHYSVQVGGQYYDTPPDGDCAFHALNILSIYNNKKRLDHYLVNPQRPDGVFPLSVPVDDTIIKFAIREIRHIICSHVIHNTDEIALAIPDQPIQEVNAPPLPVVLLPFQFSTDIVQVALPSEPSALPVSQHYSLASEEEENPSSYPGYLAILNDWSCPSVLVSPSVPSTSEGVIDSSEIGVLLIEPHDGFLLVEEAYLLESSISPTYSHDFPIVVEESQPFASGEALPSFHTFGTKLDQMPSVENSSQHGIDDGAVRQPSSKVTSIPKSKTKLKRSPTINASLLKLACDAIIGNPQNLPSFAKEHGIREKSLQLYISGNGLTLAGEQMLAQESNKNALKPITFELVQLASQSIINKGISLESFARDHEISIHILKNYLKSDGTFTVKGERVFRHRKSLFHKHVSLNPMADRITAVKDSALQLMKPGEWDFPHADLLFAHSFKMIAFDHNMQFDIKTPDYSQRIGNPEAPYIGTLILQKNHYGVQIEDCCYDVPADGDCAFHALNILRLHRIGHTFGDYIPGPQRPDGVIPLNVPADNTTIKLAIGGLRYVVAEYAIRHSNEIANAMAHNE
ncbi:MULTISPECIES: hypothetical protein [Burkholderia]|uniref:hypothetical protein n=1 Tax=Burkholderia TaxID=32008 RepID=UPI000B1C20A4|nr:MULTISPECIES: hypothetical protein [unclassified Burkholderia]